MELASLLRQHDLRGSVADIVLLDTVSAIDQALIPVLKDEAAFEPTHGTEIPLTDHQTELLRETFDDRLSNYLFYTLTRGSVLSNIDCAALRKAWEILFTRHSAFRTTFALRRSMIISDSTGKSLPCQVMMSLLL